MKSIVLMSSFVALSFAPWLHAAEIVFEQGIEYSSPGDEHLQLNLARPKQVKEGINQPGWNQVPTAKLFIRGRSEASEDRVVSAARYCVDPHEGDAEAQSGFCESRIETRTIDRQSGQRPGLVDP